MPCRKRLPFLKHLKAFEYLHRPVPRKSGRFRKLYVEPLELRYVLSTWTALANLAPASSGGGLLLLSDGSVMAKSSSGGGSYGNTWYKLTPDAAGSYINGTWTALAPMIDTRLYFSSQVLTDGRVYVAGGEYGTGLQKGEVYDPLTNSWTAAPAIGLNVSDANSEILPDGRVLQALVSGTLRGTRIYDPVTNTYATGPSSIGIHNESSWVKLPDDSILMVDRLSTNSERYIPSLNQWVADATVPVSLYDPYGLETGAAVLLPDGRAFFIGSAGTTAYYTPSGTNSPGTWAAGPGMPNGYGQPDGPAAIMVDGKIIMAISPSPTSADHFPSPTYFYEFNYLTNTFTQLAAPGGGTSINSPAFTSTFLDLPDGTVLYTRQGSSQYYVYTPDGPPLAAGKPTITSVTGNGDGTYHLVGTLLNGISEGAGYGDDWQMATNYPIIRLTSGSNVYYARTYDWDSTSVMTGNRSMSTNFSLPAGIPDGAYQLVTIANGIASDATTFLVGSIAVTATTPGVGSAVNTPPTDFVIVFSEAYDPATVQAGDLTVNGVAADSFALTNATTITFHYSTSPVTSQGTQTMSLVNGAVKALAGGFDSSTFLGTFTYDPTNDAPVLTAPTLVTIDQNKTATFAAGLAFSDVDDYLGVDEQVTITLTHGTLSATTSGLSGFSGLGTSSITLTGSVAALNNALQSLVDTPISGFVGTQVMTIDVNDQGSGLGLAAQHAGAVILIQVRPTLVAPSMTTDINTGSDSSSPTNLLTIGSITYFTADDAVHGTELWKTDGTAAGTVLLRDIYPYSTNSSVGNLTNLNGTLIFTANDGTNGTELWKSDGTTAGTVILKDINAGSGSSSPTGLTVIGTTLYFAANDGSTGTELWKSTGTSAGTTRVKDIVSGSSSSSPARLVNVNGTLFFTATDGSTSHGIELWKSNGTSAGTVMVLDINSGTTSSSPSNLTNVNGTVFFTANDGVNGTELWKSDGTSGGTVLVKDIVSGSGSPTSVANFTAVGSSLLFAANDAVNGTELWVSDGSSTGTTMIDINAGSSSSTPANFAVIGTTAYFSATNTTNGIELWKWDSVGGAVLLKDIFSGSSSSSPAGLTNVNGTLYFRASASGTGSELFKSDGTAAGTTLVKDIYSGSTASTPSNFVLLGTQVLFTATDPTYGTELWTTDGTSGGTTLVADVNTATTAASIAQAVAMGGKLYFFATDATHGAELWSSDGTTAGTSLVADYRSGTTGSSPTNMVAIGNTLYFSATNGTTGNELVKSDGTAGGTVLVKDIFSGASSSSPANLTNFNGSLYFTATDGSTAHGIELWKSDGTSAGTVMVKDINSGTASSSPANLTVFNGALYFTATDGANGIELWKTDGTDAGTVLVKDIFSGSNSSSPAKLTVFNGWLYFSATDGVNGIEFWSTDGTTGGTAMLVDILSGSSSSSPSNLLVIGNTLFFTATDGSTAHGTELWKSDGTAAGTMMVSDIYVGASSSSPANLTNVAGTLFFSATDANRGTEIWMSDGTTAGTINIDDIVPGSTGSSPSSFVAVGDTLYFGATDPSLGRELFRTYGTAGGAIMAADIFSGGYDSSPTTLAAVGNKLFVIASDGVHGAELWSTDVGNAGPSTSGLSPVHILSPTASSTVDLSQAFSDDKDLAIGLLYTIVGNTNAALFSNLAIDGNTGNLTMTYAAGVVGSSVLTIQAADSSGAAVQSTLSVDVNAAPTITGVFAKGSSWGGTFLTYLANNNLGDASLGYRLSNGANQLKTLPWTNVNTVSIRFSENVTIAQGDLTVVGASNAPSAIPGVSGFSYNGTTFTATWTFAANLPRNKYLLHLGNTVVDVGGAALDGEWTTQTSTSSGDGTSGGDFNFRFNVLLNDVDRNGTVTSTEVLQSRNWINRGTATTGYDQYRDFDGSGTIQSTEILQGRNRIASITGLNEPIVPGGSPQAAAATAPWLLVTGEDVEYVSPFAALTLDQLQPLVDEAIGRWRASGLVPGGADWSRLHFAVADLGGYLGLSDPDGLVRIDDDGAGWGWFVDATPGDDQEFATTDDPVELRASAVGPAAGRMDLLTTIMHEIGNFLGYRDVPLDQPPAVLMTAVMPTDVRRLPNIVAPPPVEASTTVAAPTSAEPPQEAETPPSAVIGDEPPSAEPAEVKSIALNEEPAAPPFEPVVVAAIAEPTPEGALSSTTIVVPELPATPVPTSIAAVLAVVSSVDVETSLAFVPPSPSSVLSSMPDSRSASTIRPEHTALALWSAMPRALSTLSEVVVRRELPTMPSTPTIVQAALSDTTPWRHTAPVENILRRAEAGRSQIRTNRTASTLASFEVARPQKLPYE